MTGLDLLLYAIPLFLALALQLALLLWCRSWWREDREEMDRRLKLLSDQVSRLSEALDQFQKAQAATKASEGRLLEQLTTLFADVTRHLSARPPSSASPAPSSSSATQHPALSRAEGSAPDAQRSPDRYERAREMLSSGADPVEVARTLDISLGDVHVLQRLLNMKPKG